MAGTDINELAKMALEKYANMLGMLKSDLPLVHKVIHGLSHKYSPMPDLLESQPKLSFTFFMQMMRWLHGKNDIKANIVQIASDYYKWEEKPDVPLESIVEQGKIVWTMKELFTQLINDHLQKFSYQDDPDTEALFQWLDATLVLMDPAGNPTFSAPLHKLIRYLDWFLEISNRK